jgi:hypothetical protein
MKRVYDLSRLFIFHTKSTELAPNLLIKLGNSEQIIEKITLLVVAAAAAVVRPPAARKIT